MSWRIVLAGLLAALVSLPLTADDKPKKDAGVSASDLSLEITALRTLFNLRATPEQMKAIGKLAKETAQKPKKRKDDASADYRKLLAELRDALAEDDDDRVESLDDQIDERFADNAPDLDDQIELTAAARKRAPEVMRLLKAPQVADYIAIIAADVTDPLDRILNSLDKVRSWKFDEWKDKRDDLGEEIGLLVAGVDKDKSGKVSKDVIALLARARTLNEDNYKKQRPELVKRARRIVADMGPTDVLRNLVEYALAELLSNARLEQALKRRASGGR